MQVAGNLETHLAYLAVHSFDLLCSYSIFRPGSKGFCLGTIVPFVSFFIETVKVSNPCATSECLFPSFIIFYLLHAGLLEVLMLQHVSMPLLFWKFPCLFKGHKINHTLHVKANCLEAWNHNAGMNKAAKPSKCPKDSCDRLNESNLQVSTCQNSIF